MCATLYVMVTIYKCKRCKHEWAGRKPTKPITCPKCRSAYWDKSRVRPIEVPCIEDTTE